MAIRMGGKHITTLSAFVRHRSNIERTCACGHRNALSSRPVWQIFREKAVPPTLERAPARFRCMRCGDRPVRLGLWKGGGRGRQLLSKIDLHPSFGQNTKMLIRPTLLKAQAIRRPTRVFLCGPGEGGANYEIREFARKTLEAIPNTTVIYGEEIETIHTFKKKRKDLQTLEAELAHSVDFTLLLLESPGSIAELGTFSMINNVRGRLVVLVPSQFYGDASYIARGPLSLLSRSFQQNVIYFDRVRNEELASRILYPLTFYKFANYRLGYPYISHITQAHRRADYTLDSYEKFIKEVRQEFATAATLLGILILGRPTFPELVASTALTPDQSNAALRRLYKTDKIRKTTNGRYRALAGYDDPLIEAFSSTSISERRAHWMADLDRRPST